MFIALLSISFWFGVSFDWSWISCQTDSHLISILHSWSARSKPTLIKLQLHFNWIHHWAERCFTICECHHCFWTPIKNSDTREQTLRSNLKTMFYILLIFFFLKFISFYLSIFYSCCFFENANEHVTVTTTTTTTKQLASEFSTSTHTILNDIKLI